MLSIENIKVSYGKAMAIDGVSLQVEEGELVTLLGSNGAGKSTLLKTISGILKPHTGTIRFDDQDLHTIFQMVGVSGVGDSTGSQPPSKKLELNVTSDNGGSWMCVYLQCKFYTKTFYKPSVFVFSMRTSNY